MISRQQLRDLASRVEDWLFQFVSDVNLGYRMSRVSVHTRVPRCMAPTLRRIFENLGRADEIGERYRRDLFTALKNACPERDEIS